MITIRNINPNLGEVGVEFTQETIQAAMDEMSQAVRDCGYECVEVCEGVDFETVSAETETITGHEAIRYAEAQGSTLSKYADPIQPAHTHLTIDEAQEIAQIDPSLIWVAAVPLPGGMIPNSVHYALDGPREQVLSRLRQIVRGCEAWGTLAADDLAEEAQDAISDLDS
jgi:hypothetical protein